jgi:hypothetical protein
MKTYSLNDCVYFKLTEAGHRVLRELSTAFHRDYPHIDIRYRPEPFRGEWYKNQMHWILSTFGGHSLVGGLLPITDLTFEEPPDEHEGTP